MSSLHSPAAELSAVRAVEADAHAAATINGFGNDLAGKRGVFYAVDVGDVGASATIDAYLQDSPDNSAWTNVNTTTYPNANITQITTDNNEVLMEYTHHGQRYVRAVLVVAVATSDCGIVGVTF